MESSSLSRAAEWIASAKKVIVFTGAGVSTESGIPDFRSATGLWVRFDPMEYATLGAFKQDPVKVWRMLAEVERILDARPNAGHRALAELEAEGAVSGLITQNIDGLHQAAGSRNVIEFHGSHRTFSCLTCGARYSREEVGGMGMPPRCANGIGRRVCGAILKPDVVLFDEMIPVEALRGADQLVRGADLVLVAGTSCEVYPAASIPHQVRDQGGKIVELNLEPADNLEADLVLQGPFSEVMPALVQRWREVRR
jgi:NAD-dependent deacetylase